jgi:formate hydrogenlyase subunit 6/NADH:ubiquinone oxidoreductase subunit I
MNTDRNAPRTVRTQSIMTEITGLKGPCIGCTECTGVCAALIDALTVPGVVLDTRRSDA